MTTPAATSLADAIWPAHDKTLIRNIVLAVAATVLLAVSAKIKVPFWPVPMTMQLFVVLAIGLAFGCKLAVGTLLLYMAEGAVGLPVFAGTPEKGIGLAYMMGPTGGYILGFLFAAGATGWLAEKGWDRSVVKGFVACLIGIALIYLPGLLWLGSIVGWDKPVLAWGFTPFILGDLVKASLAALAIPAGWSLLGKNV